MINVRRMYIAGKEKGGTRKLVFMENIDDEIQCSQ